MDQIKNKNLHRWSANFPGSTPGDDIILASFFTVPGYRGPFRFLHKDRSTCPMPYGRRVNFSLRQTDTVKTDGEEFERPYLEADRHNGYARVLFGKALIRVLCRNSVPPRKEGQNTEHYMNVIDVDIDNSLQRIVKENTYIFSFLGDC